MQTHSPDKFHQLCAAWEALIDRRHENVQMQVTERLCELTTNIVALEGPPGVGKTTFVTKNLVPILESKGVVAAYGKATDHSPPLLLLAEAMSSLLKGMVSRSGKDVVCRRVQVLERSVLQRIAAFVPDTAELLCLDEDTFRASLQEYSSEVRTLGASLFSAVTKFLRVVTQDTRCVVCLDDIQWLDELTAAGILWIVEDRIPNISFFCVRRCAQKAPPYWQEPGFDSGNRKEPAVRLASIEDTLQMDNISRVEIQDMVSEVFCELEADRVARIGDCLWKLTEGNAFYFTSMRGAVRKVCRTLRPSSADEIGHFSFEEGIGNVTPLPSSPRHGKSNRQPSSDETQDQKTKPESLASTYSTVMLLCEIKKILTPEALAFAKAAAVVASCNVFPSGVLRKSLGYSKRQLRAAINELQNAGIILRMTVGGIVSAISASDPQFSKSFYSFAHDKFREILGSVQVDASPLQLRFATTLLKRTRSGGLEDRWKTNLGIAQENIPSIVLEDCMSSLMVSSFLSEVNCNHLRGEDEHSLLTSYAWTMLHAGVAARHSFGDGGSFEVQSLERGIEAVEHLRRSDALTAEKNEGVQKADVMTTERTLYFQTYLAYATAISHKHPQDSQIYFDKALELVESSDTCLQVVVFLRRFKSFQFVDPSGKTSVAEGLRCLRLCGIHLSSDPSDDEIQQLQDRVTAAIESIGTEKFEVASRSTRNPKSSNLLNLFCRLGDIAFLSNTRFFKYLVAARLLHCALDSNGHLPWTDGDHEQRGRKGPRLSDCLDSYTLFSLAIFSFWTEKKRQAVDFLRMTVHALGTEDSSSTSAGVYIPLYNYLPLIEHISKGRIYLNRARQIAFDCGSDIACEATGYLSYNPLISGNSLRHILDTYRDNLNLVQAQDAQVTSLLRATKFLYDALVDGAKVDCDKMVEAIETSGDHLAYRVVHASATMIALSFLNQPMAAARLGRFVFENKACVCGLDLEREIPYIVPLIVAEAHRRDPSNFTRLEVETAIAFSLPLLKELAGFHNINFQHRLEAVEAEEEWLKGNHLRAVSLFLKAATRAEENGFPHHAGFLFWRASRLQRKVTSAVQVNDSMPQQSLLAKARSLIQSWGAASAVKLLDEEIEEIIPITRKLETGREAVEDTIEEAYISDETHQAKRMKISDSQRDDFSRGKGGSSIGGCYSTPFYWIKHQATPNTSQRSDRPEIDEDDLAREGQKWLSSQYLDLTSKETLSSESTQKELLHAANLNTDDLDYLPMTELIQPREWDIAWNGCGLFVLSVMVFEKLGIHNRLQIRNSTLLRFLREIQDRHSSTTFHTAHLTMLQLHALFLALRACSNYSPRMSETDLLVQVVSTLCKGVGHPGRTNQFLICTEDPMAMKYNLTDVVENNVAAEAIAIFSLPRCNILQKFSPDWQVKILRDISIAILNDRYQTRLEFCDKVAKISADGVSRMGDVEKKKFHLEFARCVSHDAYLCSDISWAQQLLKLFIEESCILEGNGLPANPLSRAKNAVHLRHILSSYTLRKLEGFTSKYFGPDCVLLTVLQQMKKVDLYLEEDCVVPDFDDESLVSACDGRAIDNQK